MAFQTSSSKPSSNKPALRLTLKDQDGNRTYINLFERQTRSGNGNFYVGNPSEKNEDGTWNNCPESFFVMPSYHNDGATLKFREGQGADLVVLSELKASIKEGSVYYGTTSTGLQVYVDKWMSKADREAMAAKSE